MPDLHTNLILNDKQFSDGLRRAESGLGRFASQVKGFSGGLKSALGLAGIGTTIGAVVDAFSKMKDAQTRVNAGVGSFEDKWTTSRGAVSNILAELPLIGQMLDRIDRSWGGFEEGRVRDDATNRGRSVMSGLNEQLEIARAQTDERREQIRLQQEDRQIVSEIVQIEKASGEYQGKLRSVSYELFNLRMKDLQIRQQAAAIEKQAAADLKIQALEKAKLNSEVGFQESMFSEQTSILRELGKTDEADRREIEQRRRQMLRNIWNDPTLEPYSDEVRRRSDEVNRIAAERLQILNEKSVKDQYARSVSGAGLDSGTLGQMFFSRTSDSQAIAKRAAEAAERQAKESARHTDMLRQIERNTARNNGYA
jgi:hypothetical protein